MNYNHKEMIFQEKYLISIDLHQKIIIIITITIIIVKAKVKKLKNQIIKIKI